MKQIISKLGCSWAPDPDKNNTYNWSCNSKLFGVKNIYNVPTQRIKGILPDQQEFFIEYLPPNDGVFVGTCYKGEEAPDCRLINHYRYDQNKNQEVCFEYYYRTDQDTVVVDRIERKQCSLYK